MTVSEYIFDFLVKKGLKKVFMVSGSSAMWLTDALYKNKDLDAVCCQHEQVAAMAADGYGRVNQHPGACLVTIGPGATNAITGVSGAYLDSSPMFVISGQANSRIVQYQKDTGIRQKGTQSLCLESMTKDIVKYFAVVMQEDTIRYHMEKAYHEAMSGRKGPVWLDVPIDIQNKQVSDEMEGYKAEEPIRATYDIQEIKQLLENARKPLILAGNGTIAANAKGELKEFVEKYQIPIVTSRGGIGAIESSHPLFVGRPGSYGDRASHFAIQECDLLFILGSRLSASTVGYYPGKLAGYAKKIMIDIDEKELAKTDVPVDIKIKEDIKSFLQMVLREKITVREHKEWILQCQNNREKYPVVQEEYRQIKEISSYYFTEVLSKLVSENSAIVVDTGSVCNIVSQTWQLKEGQEYIISGGLSCMGFWASSVGIGATGQQVIAVAGDGSVQMNVQDFATMKYYKLPIKLFVYNNRGYMLIRHNQHNYMNDRFLGVGPDSGVPAVDFCKVAEAYGLPSIQINTKEDLQRKILQVLNTDGPVICEVMMEEFGIIAPRIASKVMPDGSLKAADFDDLWPFLDRE